MLDIIELFKFTHWLHDQIGTFAEFRIVSVILSVELNEFSRRIEVELSISRMTIMSVAQGAHISFTNVKKFDVKVRVRPTDYRSFFTIIDQLLEIIFFLIKMRASERIEPL